MVANRLLPILTVGEYDFVAKFTFFTQKVKVQMVKFKIGADVFVLYSFFIV